MRGLWAPCAAARAAAGASVLTIGLSGRSLIRCSNATYIDFFPVLAPPKADLIRAIFFSDRNMLLLQ